MANTITQSASVYPPKRDDAKANYSVSVAEPVRSTVAQEARPLPVSESKPIEADSKFKELASKQGEGLAKTPSEGLAKTPSEGLVSQLKNLPQMVQRNLEFSVDDDTGMQVVRVTDAETGDLVRQIPQDQILRILAQVQDTQESTSPGPGMLLDERL